MVSVEQEKLLQRLKRIEGQIRGLQRMVTEEQSCSEILTQIAAARAALAGAAKVVFEQHSKTCIEQALSDEQGAADALEDLFRSLNRLLK